MHKESLTQKAPTSDPSKTLEDLLTYMGIRSCLTSAFIDGIYYSDL